MEKKEGRERRSQGNGRVRENFLLVEGVSSWYDRDYRCFLLFFWFYVFTMYIQFDIIGI